MEIAIIFAMEEELKAFLNLHDAYETEAFKGRTLYITKNGPHTVTALKSGIGKTHAAYVTTLYVNHRKPDALYNVGVAGGLDVPLGTLVLGVKSAYHDVDVMAFNYPHGQIPGAPETFDADPDLLNVARSTLASSAVSYVEGTLLTGDLFVQKREKLKASLERHPEARAVDMEAAAIAHVAYLEHVPFIGVRTISDVLDTDIQMDSYEEEMAHAAVTAAKAVKTMIERL